MTWARSCSSCCFSIKSSVDLPCDAAGTTAAGGGGDAEAREVMFQQEDRGSVSAARWSQSVKTEMLADNFRCVGRVQPQASRGVL